MPDLKSASSFLQAAKKDFLALKNMLDVLKFSVEIFGFHAQQVVEKCLIP